MLRQQETKLKSEVHTTQADLKAEFAGLIAAIKAMKRRIIRWAIASQLTTTAVVFYIARYVH